jgi:hypothetical protein
VEPGDRPGSRSETPLSGNHNSHKSGLDLALICDVLYVVWSIKN